MKKNINIKYQRTLFWYTKNKSNITNRLKFKKLVLLKLDESSQDGDLEALMVRSGVCLISSDNLGNFDCIEYKPHYDFRTGFRVKKMQLIDENTL